MSFILDALKKSESERQRQTGPALFEVKVAPPRTRLPVWAILVGLLLGITLLVLVWLLLRNDYPATALPQTAASTAATAARGSVAVSPRDEPRPAEPVDARAGAASRYVAATRSSLPTSEPAESVASNPLDSRPAIMPGTAEAAAAAETREEARRAASEQAALVQQQVQASAATASAARSTLGSVRAMGLPTRDEIVNSGRARVPDLQLSLHAYDPNPAKRFVFINGQRAREGDSLPNGVTLESIVRDGIILSVGGQRFVMPVQ